VRTSGVPAVILASGFYMTNVLAMVRDGVLPAPAGDGAVAMIDPRDVAAVAAVALTGDDHAGRTYRLTGPEAITHAAIADVLGAEHVDVPPEVARRELDAAGLPGWLVEHLDGAFALTRSGALAETTDVVRVVTGREPRDFAAFARDRMAAAIT
jgi:NAD(P)H dehydrogenase (quinone)